MRWWWFAFPMCRASYFDEAREAWLCTLLGAANLSAYAAPVPGYTVPEVELLFGQRLGLLEAAAPALLWLRRGPLWSEDVLAGSVALSPSRLPFASFRHCTVSKLEHDVAQFAYLAARGWRSEWVSSVVVPAYLEVLRRARFAENATLLAADGSLSDDILPLYEFSPLDVALVGGVFNRALLFAPERFHFPELGSRVRGALNDDAAMWREADAKYATGNAVVFVDDALSQEALHGLLDYCRLATLFFETKPSGAGGHLGAYVVDGFAAPLLFQLARELQERLPSTLGALPLLNMWAYKYSHAQRGIAVHKDQAAVNVNLWISPTEANLEPERGGLAIWDDRKQPLPLARSFTPPELFGDAGERTLAKLQKVIIPFRQNRLTLFDSALPHASDVGRWRDGYEQRRISVTFLYGLPVD